MSLCFFIRGLEGKNLTCDNAPKGEKSSVRSSVVQEKARLRTKRRDVCLMEAMMGSSGGEALSFGSLD